MSLTSETETVQQRRASVFSLFLPQTKKRKSEDVIILSKQRDKSVNEFDGYDPCLHWPAEEAWERQTDRVSITDHANHFEHPDVLQLGRHMEAVKAVGLTAGVGADTLHKVRSAGLQLTDHLRQRVLKERKGKTANHSPFIHTEHKPGAMNATPPPTRLHLCNKKSNLTWLDVQGINIWPYSKCCILAPMLLSSYTHTHTHTWRTEVVVHCSFIWRASSLAGPGIILQPTLLSSPLLSFPFLSSPLSCPGVPLRDSQTTNPQIGLCNTQTSFKAKVDWATLQPSCVTSRHWTASV